MSEAEFSSEAEHRRFRPYPKYKASGIEWLGEIPAHWNVKRIKTMARLNTGGTPAGLLDEAFEVEGVPWVKPDNLNGDHGIATPDRKLSPSAAKAVGIVKAGSSLVCGIGTVGKTGHAPFEVCTNQQINAITFGCEVTNRFGQFIVSCLTHEFMRRANKVTLAICNKSEMGEVSMCAPPLTEQRFIATFLDRETAKIDALIEKKERLIELLQEKRTALITQAVTKGLDPNVPMKGSGVEWLGEVPAHWDVLRLKYLSSINDEVLNEKTDPRFELIYVDIGGVDQYQGIVASEELVFETAPSRARRIVRDGDVIISTVRTYLRAIAPIKHPESNLIVSTGFAVIRPSSALECNFAPYALRASHFVERIVANSVGVSYPAIDTSKMSCFPAATPDIEEQQEIASFLESEMTKIDALVAKIREAIDRLKEYRTALISAAVTGKIDVREIIA